MLGSSPSTYANLQGIFSTTSQIDLRSAAFRTGAQNPQGPLPPSSPFGGPVTYTPRKYLKILVHVLKTLVKHHEKLSVEFLGSLKDLEAVLNQAAQPYSSAATGKLHYFLIEDLQVVQLQEAGTKVLAHIKDAAAGHNGSVTDHELQADLQELADRLQGAKCLLPASQLHLIEAFKNMCHNLDPSYDIPDGVQKAAEQVVREVIKEVHGPFFNSEILEREVGYLVRIAARIDPNTQRMDAAVVKLLASTLLNLDGDESDDEEDFDVPGADSDPFLIPSFPPMRVLDSTSRAPPTSAVAAVESALGKDSMLATGSGLPMSSPAARFAAISAVNTSSHCKAGLSTALADSQPVLMMAPPHFTGQQQLKSQLTAAHSLYVSIDDDEDVVNLSPLNSPKPTAASLAAAAALEQQQLLLEQGPGWQKQPLPHQQQQHNGHQQQGQPLPAAQQLQSCHQQQQQQQGQQQHQQQPQQYMCKGKPPRSPRSHQQQMVPPLPLQQLQQQPAWQQQKPQQHHHHHHHQQQQQQQQQQLGCVGMRRPSSASGYTSAAQHAIAAAANLGTARYANMQQLQQYQQQQQHHQQQQEQEQRQEQGQQQQQLQHPTHPGAAGGRKPHAPHAPAEVGPLLSSWQQQQQQLPPLQQQHERDCPWPGAHHGMPQAAAGLPHGPLVTASAGAVANGTPRPSRLQPVAHREPSNDSAGCSVKMLKDLMDSTEQASEQRAGDSCTTFHANMKLLDEGIEKLAKFIESTKRVKGLSLAHNSIGPIGAQRLCRAMLVYKTVQSLDLPNNELGDVGAAAIADLLEAGCRITSLQLCDNGIGDLGMVRLAQAIERNGHLERLSVYNNRIGSVGCSALANAVKVSRNLKLVEFLPGNCAPTRDVKQLAQAVKQNRRFRLRNLFSNPCMQG